MARVGKKLLEFVVGLFLMAGYSPAVGQQGNVRLDTIQVSGSHPMLTLEKFPELLCWSLTTLKVTCLDAKYTKAASKNLSRGAGILLVATPDGSRLNAQFSVSGIISYDALGNSTYQFWIADLNAHKTQQLPIVRADVNTSAAKAIHELTTLIVEQIATFNSPRSEVFVTGGLQAEVVASKPPIRELTISELLYTFSSRTPALGKYLIPWAQMKSHSFQNLDAPTVFAKEPNLDILIRGEFSYQDGYDILIQPVLFVKSSPNVSIKLNQTILAGSKSLDGYYAPIADDLIDLFAYLKPPANHQISKHAISFLQCKREGSRSVDILDSAKTHYSKKETFQALFLATKVLEVDPNNYQAHLLTSEIRYDQKRYNEAIWSIDNAIDDAPKAERAYLLLRKGSILFDLEQYTGAKDAFLKSRELNASQLISGKGDINLHLGKTYSKLSEFKESDKFLSQALTNAVGRDSMYIPEILFWKGLNAYFEKNYAVCVENLKSSYGRDRVSHPDLLDFLSEAYIELGIKSFRSRKFEAAISLGKELNSYRENYWSNYLILISLDQLLKFGESRSHIITKLEEQHFDLAIYKTQGDFLSDMFYVNSLSTRIGEESVYNYKKYLSFFPKDSVAHYNLGNVFISLNQDKEGAEYLEAALRLGHKSYTVYLDLAEAYIKSGQPGRVPGLLKELPSSSDRKLNDRNLLLKSFLQTVANVAADQKDYEAYTRDFYTLYNSHSKDVEPVVTAWRFEPLEEWLKTANHLTEGSNTTIRAMIAKMKSVSR